MWKQVQNCELLICFSRYWSFRQSCQVIVVNTPGNYGQHPGTFGKQPGNYGNTQVTVVNILVTMVDTQVTMVNTGPKSRCLYLWWSCIHFYRSGDSRYVYNNSDSDQ